MWKDRPGLAKHEQHIVGNENQGKTVDDWDGRCQNFLEQIYSTVDIT